MFILTNARVISKFNNSSLVQKSLSSLSSKFILNLYIVYELNNWPHNPTKNFPLKINLFVTAKLLRNAIKSKLICNGWGIAFGGEGSWNFGNGFTKNIVIFSINNNSLSSHTDNWKNNFLLLGEWPTDGINDGNCAAENILVLTLVKQRQDFA